MASQFRDIALSKIDLNTENDRHGPLPSQRHCIQWMLDNLGDEIYRLAKDIAKNGLSLLDNILVLSSGSGRYVVWEGNRRITALKLLDNPERCESPDLAKRYALAGKQIAYHVAFVGTLGIDIQMLQIATTAVAEMRAGRRNTLLGGGEQ